MLYASCPTCGYCLGNIIIDFKKKKNLICDNPKLSKEQREEQIQKLIISLKLRRYCCRVRVMTYKEQVKEILPIPKEN
jgi:DNA-directed RNA polymerase subunit N (RpoN/RPB10)